VSPVQVERKKAAEAAQKSKLEMLFDKQLSAQKKNTASSAPEVVAERIG
jgi:hypothetical protein